VTDELNQIIQYGQLWLGYGFPDVTSRTSRLILFAVSLQDSPYLVTVKHIRIQFYNKLHRLLNIIAQLPQTVEEITLLLLSFNWYGGITDDCYATPATWSQLDNTLVGETLPSLRNIRVVIDSDLPEEDAKKMWQLLPRCAEEKILTVQASFDWYSLILPRRSSLTTSVPEYIPHTSFLHVCENRHRNFNSLNTGYSYWRILTQAFVVPLMLSSSKPDRLPFGSQECKSGFPLRRIDCQTC
jgi:hypothetical protein